jgi:hypothetical protein
MCLDLHRFWLLYRILAHHTVFSVDLSNHGDSTEGTKVELWGRWKGPNQIWAVRQRNWCVDLIRQPVSVYIDVASRLLKREQVSCTMNHDMYYHLVILIDKPVSLDTETIKRHHCPQLRQRSHITYFGSPIQVETCDIL